MQNSANEFDGTWCHMCNANFDRQENRSTYKDQWCCFNCAAIIDVAAMREGGIHQGLYCSAPSFKALKTMCHSDACQKLTVHNWPNTLRLNVFGYTITRRNVFGRKVIPELIVYFNGPDGFVWLGRQSGDMDLIRCRRTKELSKQTRHVAIKFNTFPISTANIINPKE